MTNEIKEYKPYYTIHMKWWETIEVPYEAWLILKQNIIKSKQDFIEIWNDIYNRFEIKRICESKAIDSIQAYILRQPKQIREKINLHQKTTQIIWNSIEHVNNFIWANT